MGEPSVTQNTPASARSRAAWLGALVPLALIAAFAVGYGALNWGADDPPDPGPAPAKLDGQKAYYLAIRTVELYNTQPNGQAWDRLDNSGPDITYDLIWQNNTVFSASKKPDTLIASWDMLSVDLKSAILSGQVDLGSSIQAAIVRPDTADRVTINIYDADIASKDPAGTLELNLYDLTLGDNELTFDASDTNAIKRITLRVVDKALPTAELIEAATRP